MSIHATLNEELRRQPFNDGGDENAMLADSLHIACGYSRTENAVAVVSDLRNDKSYIYYGRMAARLGLAEKDTSTEIDSIWEEGIFERIRPEDLAGKHLLELQFFRLLKNKPVEERRDYHTMSLLWMRDKSGEYVPVLHRMFYLANCPTGSLWLALCLYSHWPQYELAAFTPGAIINSETGKINETRKGQSKNILTVRETELLGLIDKGRTSKEIAGKLSISLNTVNRHRQNILEKLRVKNSIEACRIAKSAGILSR